MHVFSVGTICLESWDAVWNRSLVRLSLLVLEFSLLAEQFSQSTWTSVWEPGVFLPWKETEFVGGELSVSESLARISLTRVFHHDLSSLRSLNAFFVQRSGFCVFVSCVCAFGGEYAPRECGLGIPLVQKGQFCLVFQISLKKPSAKCGGCKIMGDSRL